MRKQTKLVAVLSAAALLAIGASMTSMAAQGWQQEGDDWYYYDNNGDYVVNEWKKSGNNWYYLGDDGYMMKNYLLEDGDSTYYLDGNGVMVTNSWVAYTPEDDYEEDAPDHYWYYFQNNGRAVKASDDLKKKTINGKTYGFDESGRMLFGFVDDQGNRITDEDPFEDAVYYFGDSDDGAMHKGWLQYMDGSELEGTEGWDSDGAKDYDDLDEMWFYFNTSNGEKVYSENNDPKTKTINGNKYAFDNNGVMISEWVSEDASTDSEANSKYYNDQTQGWMEKRGWIWAIPSENINDDDNADETYRWFYAGSNGKTYRDDVKSINGKKYVFDTNGIMRSGLVVINDSDHIVALVDTDETEGADLMNGDYIVDTTKGTDNVGGALKEGTGFLYYFGDEETDGSMKSGKNIKIELSDDEYTFGFEKNGKAYNGEEDSKIYLNGVLAEASSDYRYQAIKEVTLGDGTTDSIMSGTDSVKTEENGLKYDNYVVGTSGNVVKEGKYVKDSEDGYYAVYGAKKDVKEASDYTDNDKEKDGYELATRPDGLEKGDIAYFEDSDNAKDMAKDFAECGAYSNSPDADDYVSVCK